jgi:hypothetical protein
MINVRNIKSALFGAILLFLWLPSIQTNFKLIDEKPLAGVYELIPKKYFTINDWLNESYQQNFEAYNNQNLSFKNTLVRMHNQVGYSLYNEARAIGVVIGKDNYVFNYDYLNAALGNEYVGEAQINEKTYKLAKVQDTLQKLNKHIFIVLAPGKASYFYEFIPNSWLPAKPTTNYESYVAAFKKANINYLDFKQWFALMKPTAKYPLYPKAGFHWSVYGEYLVADSLLSYLETRNKIDLPEIVLDSITMQQYNSDYEYDAGAIANIMQRVPTYPLALPHTHFNKTGKAQLKTLVVADSYYNVIWQKGLSANAFDNGEYWYYNKRLLTSDPSVNRYINDVDVQQEVQKYQEIIIMSSDVNLNSFGFNFIETLYDIYFDKNYSRNKRIQQITATINSTPDWLDKIKQQAINENITLDKAIENNVEYVMREEAKNKIK